MKKFINYTIYRAVLGFQKFPKYLASMKRKYPDKDLHHLLGSILGKKFTDALVVPIPHNFHLNVVEKNKAEYFDKYLTLSIIHFLEYMEEELGFTTQEIEALHPDNEPQTVKKIIETAYQGRII